MTQEEQEQERAEILEALESDRPGVPFEVAVVKVREEAQRRKAI